MLENFESVVSKMQKKTIGDPNEPITFTKAEVNAIMYMLDRLSETVNKLYKVTIGEELKI